MRMRHIVLAALVVTTLPSLALAQRQVSDGIRGAPAEMVACAKLVTQSGQSGWVLWTNGRGRVATSDCPESYGLERLPVSDVRAAERAECDRLSGYRWDGDSCERVRQPRQPTESGGSGGSGGSDGSGGCFNCPPPPPPPPPPPSDPDPCADIPGLERELRQLEAIPERERPVRVDPGRVLYIRERAGECRDSDLFARAARLYLALMPPPAAPTPPPLHLEESDETACGPWCVAGIVASGVAVGLAVFLGVWYGTDFHLAQ